MSYRQAEFEPPFLAPCLRLHKWGAVIDAVDKLVTRIASLESALEGAYGEGACVTPPGAIIRRRVVVARCKAFFRTLRGCFHASNVMIAVSVIGGARPLATPQTLSLCIQIIMRRSAVAAEAGEA